MLEFNHKIDPHLKNIVSTQSNVSVPCIVYINNAIQYRQFFSLVRFYGINVLHRYPFINAFGVNLNSNQLNSLAEKKEIKYITRQTSVTAQMDIARSVINADTFYKNGFTGTDMNVAIIDTGVQPHIDFLMPKHRIKFFKDFVNDKNNVYDDNGHGTAVAGILGGSGLISKGKYKGVAPDCNLIILKALDNNGETGAFTILEAMQWLYENAKTFNIKVVCMSFGSAPLGVKDPLAIGAEALWREGITVVAAAGNSGPMHESIKSPGTNPRIITVGALDDMRDDDGNIDKSKFKVAEFSSRGPAFMHFKPDIIAPGVRIMTVSNKVQEQPYATMSGTSMATPIVAGLACLLLQKQPELKPDEVKTLIMHSANQIGLDRNTEGLGIVNAVNILKSI